MFEMWLKYEKGISIEEYNDMPFFMQEEFLEEFKEGNYVIETLF